MTPRVRRISSVIRSARSSIRRDVSGSTGVPSIIRFITASRSARTCRSMPAGSVSAVLIPVLSSERGVCQGHCSTTKPPAGRHATKAWPSDDNHEEGDTTMKKTKSGVEEGKGGDSPSQRIDARSKELSDWRGETLARIRMLIKQADPEVVEEVKWRKPSNSMAGVPVWSHAGIICTGETYKNVVKMTFAKG